MSGEGSCCSNANYADWGFAPGTYPVNCIDCPPDQPEEDKILGTVSSMRCLLHTIEARAHYGRHTEGCTLQFYEPEPFNLGQIDDWVLQIVDTFKVCFWAFIFTCFAFGAIKLMETF
jgi:hypothetical protein